MPGSSSRQTRPVDDPDGLQHQPVTLTGGIEPAGRQHRPLLVDHLDRYALLVRVHTHDHSTHLFPPTLQPVIGEDGQSDFEPGNPLSSHASPRHPTEPHAR
ncbi:MAG TPA: hypothetical protein VM688_04290 [Nocardioidaceae bacterium]|jgi:hypothetical protein|nr:hypothetical protein [Nocardioidaceae bacterium]